MSSLLQNPIVMAVLNVTLALYAASIAPKLPPNVTEMLGNTYVKIAFIAVMILLAGFDAQMSVLIAVVYVALINVASGRSFLESFTQEENKKFAGMYMLGMLGSFGIFEGKEYVTPKGQSFANSYFRGQPMNAGLLKWYINYLVQTGNLPRKVFESKMFREFAGTPPEKPRVVSKEVMIYVMGMILPQLGRSGDITDKDMNSLKGNLVGIFTLKRFDPMATCKWLREMQYITPDSPICVNVLM